MDNKLIAISRIASKARRVVNDVDKLEGLLSECGFGQQKIEKVTAKLCNIRSNEIQFLANALSTITGPSAATIDGLAPPIDDDETVDHVSANRCFVAEQNGTH